MVLLAEDWLPLAVEAKYELQDAGLEVVGPAKTVCRARELAETEPVDCALLDVDLDGELVFPVAYELTRRGIPFALMSGFARDTMPADLQHAPFFPKPLDFSAVIECLNTLIAEREGRDGQPERPRSR